MEQQILERANEMHTEAEALEERIGFIEQQIIELRDFEGGLGRLEETKNKEMLAGIGKGVFLKSTFEKKELFVDVGAGVIVKKDLGSVMKVIGEQIERLEALRDDARARLGELKETFDALIEQISAEKLFKGHQH